MLVMVVVFVKGTKTLNKYQGQTGQGGTPDGTKN